jgi:hypothetical protein
MYVHRYLLKGSSGLLSMTPKNALRRRLLQVNHEVLFEGQHEIGKTPVEVRLVIVAERVGHESK